MPIFTNHPPTPVTHPVVPDFAALAKSLPFMGSATSPIEDVLGGGYMQQFQNATAYGLFGGVPHEVHGPIRDKYNQLGGPAGFLGFPTSSQIPCPDGKGAFNHFTGGSIYYHPSVGAFQIGGLIELEWNSLGGPQYGYPNTDESGCLDGVGRYNHFTSLLPDGTTAQASIYWTNPNGAHEVRGAIHSAWASLGWETSYLGYPISDEHDADGGRQSDFQNGSILWTTANGIQLQPQSVFVNAPDITFSGKALIGVPVGGNAQLVLFSDGTTHFFGHLYDSGFPSYDCLAVFAVKDAQGRAYAASESGHLNGSDSEGPRNHDWDNWSTSPDVRANWSSIYHGGTGGGTVSVTSDWSAQKIAEDVASVVGVILAIVTLPFWAGSSKPKNNTSYDTDPNAPSGYATGQPDVGTA